MLLCPSFLFIIIVVAKQHKKLSLPIHQTAASTLFAARYLPVIYVSKVEYFLCKFVTTTPVGSSTFSL